jgi:copper resistance protein C
MIQFHRVQLHRFRRTAAALLLSFAVVCTALAHTPLQSTEPKNGATITQSPSEIKLHFKDAVTVTAVTLQEEKGAKQEFKLMPVPAKDIALPVAMLVDGRYTVSLRALGDDGHIMTGKFTFTLSTKQ